MAAHAVPPPEVIHPSPHRKRVRLGALWFGLVAAPLAWSAQILAGAALSGHDCYPHETPLANPLWHGLWPILLLISIVDIAIASAGGVIAWRSWQQTRHEQPDSAHGLMTRGEGRTRFMAMSGILTSALFLLGLLFSIAAVFMVPLCY
ncbi:MAG: hypothetical protein M3Z35_00540 [Nitrospirota bacterium]|nr:hypothetical protein [Nitrospirota bacterium]